MRRRMHRTHLHVDAMRTLGLTRREPQRPLPTGKPEPRPGVDPRTDRHRMRAMLHDAERGGEADDLVA